MAQPSKTRTSIGGFGGRGWFIIIYCGLMFWFFVGMVNDGQNFTAPAFAAKTGIDYPLVLSMSTIAGIVGVILFILFGQINRKLGAVKASTLSLVIGGLAYIMVGQVNTLASYAVVLCVLGGSMMSAGYISGGILVANWFPKKRGIVMGYTTMGHNLASAFYVPLIALLVGGYGLTRGVMLPGILTIILGVIGLIFVKNTPQERGVFPDNVDEATYRKEYFTDNLDEDGGWTTKALLKNKQLWLSATSTGIIQLITTGIMTQLVVRNVSLGFEEGQAVAMMTVLALIGVVGSWAFGVIDQKLGTKKSMYIFVAWEIIALAANVSETQFGIYLSVVMIGAAIGGSANFTVSLPANVFGRHGFSKVNSVVFPIQGFFTSIAFVINAIALSLFGTLRAAYVIFIILIAFDLLLIRQVKEGAYNRDFQAEEKLVEETTES
ncbi:hypothetical protein AGMMS49983_20950 [Clostridia bacterium]|nr:hypothetical protein AGMMS49983_20950 [Clostridia bacterium]